MEFWSWRVSEPTSIAEFARRSEAQGWDGIGLGDSQSLTGDPYVCLAVAATVTDRLGLATSVTNPVTRHVSVATTSAMYGEVAGPTDENQDEVFHELHNRYGMNLHGREGGHQITVLTDDFMDGYAIVGPADYCPEKLAALA